MEQFESRYLTTRFISAMEQGPYLMIVLHGLGDSMDGYGWLPSALRIPNLSYLLVNAPDGYFGGYSWYDFMGDPAQGIRRSRTLLLELLNELEEAGYPTENILLFGFSQGCLMVLDIALRCAQKLRGICGVSGYVGLAGEYPENLSALGSRQNILLTHGFQDPVVPFENSAKQYARLQQLGIPLEFKTYAKAHTILEEELGDIRLWAQARLDES